MKKIASCLMALMLIIFAAVPAFAASDVKSPDGKIKYKVTIISTTGGSASYEFTTEINEKGEQGVRLNAKTDTNYKFDHWKIEGSYTTDGSLKNPTLDITITSDITVTPYFVKSDGTTEPTKPVVIQKDTSPSSPKTGRNDAPLYAIILFAVAACGVAAFKFVKSK